MKKFILLLIILIGFTLFYFGKNKDNGILIVGMECDYAPNNWEERRPSDSNLPLENHEGFYAEGYDLQIAKFIAEELGYKLKVKKIAWNNLLDALNNKEIDAVFSGMLDTEERRKRAAFSQTYEIDKPEYTVVVNKASRYSRAKSFKDLAGASLIAQKGTNLDASIEQIPGVVHSEPTETVAEMIQSVVQGKVDGMVINFDTGETYVNTYKNLTLIRFPEGEGFVLGFNGICAAVRKQDKKLLAGINDVLSGMSRKQRQRIMDRTISRVWENL